MQYSLLMQENQVVTGNSMVSYSVCMTNTAASVMLYKRKLLVSHLLALIQLLMYITPLMASPSVVCAWCPEAHPQLWLWLESVYFIKPYLPKRPHNFYPHKCQTFQDMYLAFFEIHRPKDMYSKSGCQRSCASISDCVGWCTITFYADIFPLTGLVNDNIK